jgi:hypothetical protein
MATQRDLVKTEARSRGRSALVAAIISSFLVGASLSIGSTLLVVTTVLFGLGYTGQRTWAWLRYRGENGLKF